MTDDQHNQLEAPTAGEHLDDLTSYHDELVDLAYKLDRVADSATRSLGLAVLASDQPMVDYLRTLRRDVRDELRIVKGNGKRVAEQLERERAA